MPTKIGDRSVDAFISMLYLNAMEYAKEFKETMSLIENSGPPIPRSDRRLAVPVGSQKRIDRNSACPCGSGKKWKKCCTDKKLTDFNEEN